MNLTKGIQCLDAEEIVVQLCQLGVHNRGSRKAKLFFSDPTTIALVVIGNFFCFFFNPKKPRRILTKMFVD